MERRKGIKQTKNASVSSTVGTRAAQFHSADWWTRKQIRHGAKRIRIRVGAKTQRNE
jgi:hypothetical protein